MADETIDPGSARGKRTISPDGEDPSQTPRQVGRYILHEKLGTGGMGVVWRATQTATKRAVALKLIKGSVVDNPSLLLRFEREVQLAARLEHPNIARVYDSGSSDGVCYYAMELVPGADLQAFCDGKKLNDDAVVKLMTIVARAVQFAHQRGIIHRDLKPANVLISEDDLPKVTDFGLARLMDVDTGKSMGSITLDGGAPAGTPGYMPPEQARGDDKAIDTRSDVFALGAMLFSLLTRTIAYDLTGSQLDVLQRIASGEPRRPRSVRPDLDPELEAIILKAMAHAQDQRYGSAGELADDLERFINREPILARPQTTLYLLGKKFGKNRGKVALACILLVLAAGGGVYANYLVVSERNEAISQRDRAIFAEHVAQTARQDSQKNLVSAERNLDIAKQAVNRFLKRIGGESLMDTPQLRPLRGQMLSDAETYYRRLLENDPDDISIKRSLAEVLASQGSLYRRGQDWENAIERNKLALSISPQGTTDISEVDFVIQSYNSLAYYQLQAGDLEGARDSVQKLQAYEARLAPALQADPRVMTAMRQSEANSGQLLRAAGRANEAIAPLKEAIAQEEKNMASERAGFADLNVMFVDLSKLATLYNDQGDIADMRSTCDEQVKVMRSAVASSPGNSRELSYLSQALEAYADRLRVDGILLDAKQYANQSIVVALEAKRIRPDEPDERISVSRSQSILGRIEEEDGHPERALIDYKAAIDILEKLMKDQPAFGEARYGAAYQYALTAEPLALLGKSDEAKADLQSGYDLARQAEPVSDASRRARQLYSRLSIAQAVVCQCAQDAAGSQSAIDEARRLLEGIDATSRKVRHDLAYLQTIPSMHVIIASKQSTTDASPTTMTADASASMSATTLPADELALALNPSAALPTTTPAGGSPGSAAPAAAAPSAAAASTQVSTASILDANDLASINARVGQFSTVAGLVKNVTTSRSGVILIHFDGEQSLAFEGVVLAKNADQVKSDLGGDIDALFTGKHIQLSGQIETYNGHPEILIFSGGQIKVSGNGN